MNAIACKFKPDLLFAPRRHNTREDHLWRLSPKCITVIIQDSVQLSEIPANKPLQNLTHQIDFWQNLPCLR